jgi:hypothetical protein
MKGSAAVMLLLLGVCQGLQSQEPYIPDPDITAEELLPLKNLPRLHFPEDGKYSDIPDLPAVHDNGDSPYLRPVFYQVGYTCGQAASIGYNFTYEMNRVRDLPADTSVNQYPPQFAFNFFCKGLEEYGISYNHTFELLKTAGTPSVYDYGGMGDNVHTWITGYDTYYNGMFNRLDGVSSIYVGNEEGLLTLKYWLLDHLDGTTPGGLANFYASGAYFTSVLPSGTPMAGSHVVTKWDNYLGHAMTIIGWNDSIRWDYNNDGQYTNDIDINGDSVIDMKDWEIGGVRFINSHGNAWADSGFCYLMYHVLALEEEEGGIWDKTVQVIKVRENYEPQLTYKIKMSATSRDRVRVLAGVSSDTGDVWPACTMDFDIFNFQGGPHFMQGFDSCPGQRSIEFGLDVTPLLSHIESGKAARFFFQVIERDLDHASYGEVESFSLLDYTGAPVEISCPEGNVPTTDNGFTTLSLVHTVNFSKLKIETENLPPFYAGEPFGYQLTASGGEEPYRWELIRNYSLEETTAPYPQEGGQALYFPTTAEGQATMELGFPFPFYGNTFHTITVHIDGFLKFNDDYLPFPYQVYDMHMFRQTALVAPFLNEKLEIVSGDDGVWYAGDTTHATIRWKLHVVDDNEVFPVDFMATLFPDGRIICHIEDFEVPERIARVIGVSAGDGTNYTLAGFSNALPEKDARKFLFAPETAPPGLDISETGWLSFTPDGGGDIYHLSIKASDHLNVSASRDYWASENLAFGCSITSGQDDQVDCSEIAHLGLWLQNTGENALDSLGLYIHVSSPFITLLDSTEYIGTLQAGQEFDMPEACSFFVSGNVPDGYGFFVDFTISSTDKTWKGNLASRAYAPSLVTGPPRIIDNDDGILSPGETADLIIPLINTGHTPIDGINGMVSCTDPWLIFPESGYLYYGSIQKGGTVGATVRVKAGDQAPQGRFAGINLEVYSHSANLFTDSMNLLCGRLPVAIIDLDPESISGPEMGHVLDELNVACDYYKTIPQNLGLYQSLFVTLGRKFNQYVLKDYEGEQLAAYVESGRNIYMEGGLTWHDDPPTDVHALFHADDIPVSGWSLNDSTLGLEGTFTEGMKFDYVGPMKYYNYYLSPEPPAFAIFTGVNPGHVYAVACDAGAYKTIASTMDFGGYDDHISPSTKKDLMSEILAFFGIDITSQVPPSATRIPPRLRCAPNPFQYSAVLTFFNTDPGPLEVVLYDLMGNRVKTLMNTHVNRQGIISLTLDGTDIPKGMYLCLLRTNHTKAGIKVVKLP